MKILCVLAGTAIILFSTASFTLAEQFRYDFKGLPFWEDIFSSDEYDDLYPPESRLSGYVEFDLPSNKNVAISVTERKNRAFYSDGSFSTIDEKIASFRENYLPGEYSDSPIGFNAHFTDGFLTASIQNGKRVVDSFTSRDTASGIDDGYAFVDLNKYSINMYTDENGNVKDWKVSFRHGRLRSTAWSNRSYTTLIHSRDTTYNNSNKEDLTNPGIYLDNLGTLPQVYYNKEEYNPWNAKTNPEHIIVLSHGLSPGRDVSDPNYLLELKETILNRLASEEVDLDTIHFITPTWGEAYVPIYRYNSAYTNTRLAGRRLANEVKTLHDVLSEGRQSPTIHMIGHSLGTIVNAEAVSILNDDQINVDLVTILDSPRQALLHLGPETGIKSGNFRKNFASFDSALRFYKKMPEGSVDFVQNYYGGKDISGQPAFGQPIAGTLPLSGQNFSGLYLPEMDHTQVWKGYYQDLVQSDLFWKTPALYEDSNLYSPDLVWKPSSLLEDVIERYNGLSLGQGFVAYFSVNLVIGDSIFIDAVHKTVGTIAYEESGVRAISNSPSAFSSTADLDAILGLEFSYLVEGAQTGILSLAFEDEILWSINLNESGAPLSDTIYVSVFDLEGIGDLLWTYDSDEIGSSTLFSNFRIVVGIVVPEPTGAMIFLTAACCLGFQRRDIRNMTRAPASHRANKYLTIPSRARHQGIL